VEKRLTVIDRQLIWSFAVGRADFSSPSLTVVWAGDELPIEIAPTVDSPDENTIDGI